MQVPDALPFFINSCVFYLLNLLFQAPEQFGMEKLLNRHIQAVTELFDRGDCDALVSAADNVIDRRLGHAAHGAELVDGDIPFPA